MAYQKDPNALDQESGLPAIYHVAINAAFLAIKTMERFNERWEKESCESYDNLPPEVQRSVDKAVNILLGRCDEDWSEG